MTGLYYRHDLAHFFDLWIDTHHEKKPASWWPSTNTNTYAHMKHGLSVTLAFLKNTSMFLAPLAFPGLALILLDTECMPHST